MQLRVKRKKSFFLLTLIGPHAYLYCYAKPLGQWLSEYTVSLTVEFSTAKF